MATINPPSRISVPSRMPVRRPRVPKLPRSKTRRTNTWSVFLVTINSNKVPRKDSQVHFDLLVRLCQQATEALFHENNIGDLVTFNPGWEGDSYAANVLEYKFNGAVEVGAKQNYAVHTHVTLMFKHNSNIRLNRDLLMTRFRDLWNALAPPSDTINGNPYVNIVAASHNVANWLLYQQKDQDTIPTQTTDPATGQLVFTTTD